MRNLITPCVVLLSFVGSGCWSGYGVDGKDIHRGRVKDARREWFQYRAVSEQMDDDKIHNRNNPGQESREAYMPPHNEPIHTQRRQPSDKAVAVSRTRRSFYPGTIWCGPGARGDNNTLGRYNETDRCCRDHDHCPYQINRFQRKWGLRNWSIFTINHCDCDANFLACLNDVDTYPSYGVRYSFFMILRLNCFTLKDGVATLSRVMWEK